LRNLANRDHPNCVALRSGRRHWGIFSDLCRSTGAVGNAVPDAFNAALAIEHGCEFMTTDKGLQPVPWPSVELSARTMTTDGR